MAGLGACITRPVLIDSRTHVGRNRYTRGVGRFLLFVILGLLGCSDAPTPPPTPIPVMESPPDLRSPGEGRGNCGRGVVEYIDGIPIAVPKMCQEVGRDTGDPPDALHVLPAPESR